MALAACKTPWFSPLPPPPPPLFLRRLYPTLRARQTVQHPTPGFFCNQLPLHIWGPGAAGVRYSRCRR